MYAFDRPCPSEVVLVEILTRIGLTACRGYGHGAKIVEKVIELHGICNHGCSWLGRGNVVGVLIGSRSGPKPQLLGAVGNCSPLLRKGIAKVGV